MGGWAMLFSTELLVPHVLDHGHASQNDWIVIVLTPTLLVSLCFMVCVATICRESMSALSARLKCFSLLKAHLVYGWLGYVISTEPLVSDCSRFLFDSLCFMVCVATI